MGLEILAKARLSIVSNDTDIRPDHRGNRRLESIRISTDDRLLHHDHGRGPRGSVSPVADSESTLISWCSQLAWGRASGILLDAIVVRSRLEPALLASTTDASGAGERNGSSAGIGTGLYCVQVR